MPRRASPANAGPTLAQLSIDFEAAPLSPPITQQPLDECAVVFAAPNEPAVERPASFAAWLLALKHRKGWIGDLAKAAGADREFPKLGDPHDVGQWLCRSRADGDAHEALADAEREWLSA
jgi:hypothetical protein